MAVYNIHAGHCPAGKGASGAVGILNESNEARAVKNEVIAQLRAKGHTVYDCTCEENTTQNGCLQKIVAKCNAHSVNLDVSIHLNAGRNDYNGDGKFGGTEVFCYDSKTYAVAKNIVDNISKTFGYGLRSDGTTPYSGVKKSTSLYVLRKTKAPAILIECCFVDDVDDARVWDAQKCGKAIAEGILGVQLSGTITNGSTSSSNSSSSSGNCLGKGDSGSAVKELQTMLIACGYSCGSTGADGIFGTNTDSAVRKFQRAYGLAVDGLAGVNTMSKLRSVYSGGGNWIAQLQAECNVQGFSNQKVDGIAGKNTLAGCPTLRKGAKGNITRIMQKRLISLGYSCGSTGADGDFGKNTYSAVKRYQKAKGLTQDGIVGQNTWRKLLGL